MTKPSGPKTKGHALRREMTRATFRGGVKCSAPFPVEDEFPDHLQELLRKMDEAEKKLISPSTKNGL